MISGFGSFFFDFSIVIHDYFCCLLAGLSLIFDIDFGESTKVVYEIIL